MNFMDNPLADSHLEVSLRNGRYHSTYVPLVVRTMIAAALTLKDAATAAIHVVSVALVTSFKSLFSSNLLRLKTAWKASRQTLK